VERGLPCHRPQLNMVLGTVPVVAPLRPLTLVHGKTDSTAAAHGNDRPTSTSSLPEMLGQPLFGLPVGALPIFLCGDARQVHGIPGKGRNQFTVLNNSLGKESTDTLAPKLGRAKQRA